MLKGRRTGSWRPSAARRARPRRARAPGATSSRCAPAQGRWTVGRARPVRRRWACRRWSRTGRSRAPSLRMRRTSRVHPRAFVSPCRRKRTSSRTEDVLGGPRGGPWSRPAGARARGGVGPRARPPAALARRSREQVGAPEPAPGAKPMTLEREPPRVSWRRRLLTTAICVAIPIALWDVAPPEGMSATGWRVALLLAAATAGWLLEPIADFAVALLLAAAWAATGLVPLATAFGGFATSSWLVSLGGLAVAGAMAQTGLAVRGALAMPRPVPPSGPGQILALVGGGFVFTPLVPQSAARVATIAPVAAELAQSLGYAPRSRGSAAIAFAGLAGYWFFSSIFLTGLATNFVLVQLLPPDLRLRFGWTGWLGAALPAGIVCLLGATAAIFLLFRPEPSPPGVAQVVRRQQHVLGPLTRAERVTLVAVAVLIGGLVQPFLAVDAAWWGLLALAVLMAGPHAPPRVRAPIRSA